MASFAYLLFRQERGYPRVHFDFWTVVLTAVNVGIVIFVLKLILFGPLGKILQEREEKIEQSLSKAASAQKEAEELLQKYQAQIGEAKKEAQAIIERANKIGMQTREEIIKEAQEEAQKTLEKAKREIQGEKAKALEHIRNEAAVLAVMAAGKVINKQLDPEQHKSLVQEYINEVGEVQ
jgi:F-type H+-transporting ATPase subunit b